MLVYRRIRRGNSNYIILHPIRYPKIFPRKPMENSQNTHSFVSSNGWQVRPPLAALHWPSQRAPSPWTPLGWPLDGLNMEITLVERQSRRMFTITTIITIKSLLPLLIIGVFFPPRFLDPSLEHPDPSSGNTCTDLNPSLKDLKVKTRGPDLFIPN